MLLVKYTTAGTPVYESELGPNIGYDGCEEHYTIFETEDDMVDDYAADPESFSGTPTVIAELSREQAALLRNHLNDYFDALVDAESTSEAIQREAGLRP